MSAPLATQRAPGQFASGWNVASKSSVVKVVVFSGTMNHLYLPNAYYDLQSQCLDCLVGPYWSRWTANRRPRSGYDARVTHRYGGGSEARDVCRVRHLHRVSDLGCSRFRRIRRDLLGFQCRLPFSANRRRWLHALSWHSPIGLGVFYVTFLPQFIPSGVNVVGFSVLLALIHDVEGILWFPALTLATQPLVHWLCRPKILIILNRVTGGMFILFGARLALERKE